jgi:hypothetical protein
MGLVNREDDGLADCTRGVSLGFFEKTFAHQPVAGRSKNLLLQVLDCEALLLLVNEDGPARVVMSEWRSKIFGRQRYGPSGSLTASMMS